MPGMAAYGTPGSSRVPPALSIAAGSGCSWAGGGKGMAGVGTELLTSGGRARRKPVRSASARTTDGSGLRRGRPGVVRHELHVVLLGGGLHARELRDERRLVLGAGIGRRPHVLEEALEAAGEGAHHPGVLDD